MANSIFHQPFDAHKAEAKWCQRWEKDQLYTYQVSPATGENFTIAIPPPNVTGTLHMGHGFESSVIDTLVRYHRMKGDQTRWIVGTDHAGIATQMVVERQLAQANQTRQSLGREAFEKKVWEWKGTSGRRITEQLRRLGCSVDWEHEAFTMDQDYQQAVSHAFVKLHELGLIYQAHRMVNWDPVLKTAVSDLEVVSTPTQGKLYYLKYPLSQAVEGIDHIVVATTRPETMLGDSAVAVHPEDPLADLLTQVNIILPLVDREIPIVKDTMVDRETGSGFVKLTPAHDFNDFEAGKRHNLAVLEILDAQAKVISGEKADALNIPKNLQGLDRFEARNLLIQELKDLSLVEKISSHHSVLPIGDRSGALVEPKLTTQWYLKTESMANNPNLKPNAISAVENNDIQFIPESWKNMYFGWMRDIHDWCISRQLWWGHRIPAWYLPEGEVFVGDSLDDVIAKNPELAARKHELKRDEDVLDTWFSSALWTFATLGWPNKDWQQSLHPTTLLVTGFDIIFFWVARMILMSTQLLGEVPFSKVMIHGLILDGKGQKMSKSKGNVLDPIDLIEGIELPALIEKRTQGMMLEGQIEKITKQTKKEFPDGISSSGTDALRLTFASLSGVGREIQFDLKRLNGYRNFCTKLWNASRLCMMSADLVPGWQDLAQEPLETYPGQSIEHWITSMAFDTADEVALQLENHRLDLAVKAYHHFSWHIFCDWYLELCKARLSSDLIDQQAKANIIACMFDTLAKVTLIGHPLIPFITEEIYANLPQQANDNRPLIISPWPKNTLTKDQSKLQSVLSLQEVVDWLRSVRGTFEIPPSVIFSINLDLNPTIVRKDDQALFLGLIESLARVKIDANTIEQGYLPAWKLDHNVVADIAEYIDIPAQLKKLDKKLEQATKQQENLSKQLANQNFVSKAPANVLLEKKAMLDELTSTISSISHSRAELVKLSSNS